MMRQPPKQRTIGSGVEFDAMLAENGLTRASFSLDHGLSSPTAADGARLDGYGNPILGGELVVKVVDAQVLPWAQLEERRSLPPAVVVLASRVLAASLHVAKLTRSNDTFAMMRLAFTLGQLMREVGSNRSDTELRHRELCSMSRA